MKLKIIKKDVKMDNSIAFVTFFYKRSRLDIVIMRLWGYTTYVQSNNYFLTLN